MKLENFKVLTFDCYGTLIEWESRIWNGFSSAAARAEHGHGGIGPSVEVRPSQIRGRTNEPRSDLNASSEQVLHVVQSLRHDHEPARGKRMDRQAAIVSRGRMGCHPRPRRDFPRGLHVFPLSLSSPNR